MLKSLPLSRFDAVNLCFFSVFKLIIIYFPESWSMHIRCTTVWFYILNHVWPVGSCWNSSNPHAVQSAPMLQVAAQTAVARGNGMQQVEKTVFLGWETWWKNVKKIQRKTLLFTVPLGIFLDQPTTVWESACAHGKLGLAMQRTVSSRSKFSGYLSSAETMAGEHWLTMAYYGYGLKEGEP